MSKTVDQRIVEMQFDNSQFEKNVETSLSTLDKLKEALGFKNVSKGFNEITSTSKNVDMSPLSRTVDTIQAKFSALDVMAVTALANITNSAINLGKQLINTFAIEPLSTGFEEYELKMGSVQTIMAATGESLDTVNKYLQELNTYSDKTIYSFSDMTQNIGKFTNAGVKLEDAVMAIKGISNEAAVSGANANEASRAMYNFAQALSAGYVKLIDWKSIELANIATVEFKEQLLESAAAAGTLEKTTDGMYKVLSQNLNGQTMDEAIDATHNFNDSLSYQWMTTETLVNTLKDYADETTDIGKKAYASAQDVKTFSMMMDTLKEAAQSGWSETWENVFGDFEEAKSLWTDLANTFGDIIQKSADSRNALLSGGLSTGWKQLLNQGINDAEAYKEAIVEAGKAQGAAVDEIIESTGSFADSLKEGWVTADMLEEALTKLADKTRGLSDEQLAELGYTRDQIDSLEALETSVKDGSVSLEDFADKMSRLSGRENIIASLKNSLSGLSSILKPIKDGFGEIFPAMSAEQLYGFTEKLAELTEKFKMSDETAENLKSTFKGLFAVLDIIKQGISALIKGFSTTLGYVLPFGTNILEVTAGIGDFIVKIDKAVKEIGIFNGIAETAVSIFGGFIKFIGNAAKGVWEFFKALKNGNAGNFTGFFDSLLNVGSEIGEMFLTLKDKIAEAVKNLSFDDLFNVISTGAFFVIIKKLKDFIDELTGTLDDINIFGSVKDIFK